MHRIRMLPRVTVSALMAFAAPLAACAQAGGAASRAVRGCYLTDVQREPITLRDGANVTVNTTGIAVNGDALMLLGEPVGIWRSSDAARHHDDAEPTAVGVVKRPDGGFALVPSPTPPLRVQAPRATRAGPDAWHVMFVTGALGTRTNALMFDSATVWYGLFAHGAWKRVERVAAVRGANLLPIASSALLSVRNELVLAFSYEDNSVTAMKSVPSQGVVLLRRRIDASWQADTLKTWEAPRTVELVANPDGMSLTVVLTQSYFRERRPWQPAVFTVRYDSTWHQPVRQIDRNPSYVTGLGAGRAGSTLVVSLRSGLPGERRPWLEWATSDSSGPLVGRGRIAPLEAIDRPAVILSDSGAVLWGVRDGQSRSMMHFYMARDSRVLDLGVVQIPLDNFVTMGARLPRARNVVATGTAHSTNGGLPSSVLTYFRVACRPK
ncbi:MAG: hypothetical protein ACYC6C_12290 [Coriobacteriia bacterium]